MDYDNSILKNQHHCLLSEITLNLSLQAEFMETKYNGHIHRYGTPIFGRYVVYISKPINNNNQIL